MKFVAYGGETIALVLAQPDWSVRPKCIDTLPFTSIDKAVSARESRQNFGRSSRYLLEYTPRWRGAAKSTEFRIGLNRLAEETVAVPLWLDGILISSPVTAGDLIINKTSNLNPARYGSEWIILPPPGSGSSDFETYEIVVVSSVNAGTIVLNVGTALSWPAGAQIFPLLFGRFDPRPSLESITPQTIRGGLQIRENSTFARRINPAGGAIPTVGAGIPAFSTTTIWDIESEWTEMLDTAEIDIAYEQLGFLRQEQSYTAQQTIRRGLEMSIVCKSREAIAKVERIFANQRGPMTPLFVPTFRADLVPTEDVPISGATNHIHIASSEYSDPARPPHPGDGYVAFIDPSQPPGNATVDPQKITNVTGTDLTTAVAITLFHPATTTRLSFLLLARFAEAQLTWEYSTPIRATVRIRFLEVADEYVTPNTSAEPAFLYKFTHWLPTPVVQYFTSYENSISWSGQTWTPAPFSHGTIKSDTKLSREEVELTSWGGNFPTNPLAKFLPYSLEGNLFLDIVRVNAAAPGDGSATIIFAGNVSKPDFTGKNWKATARWLGNFLDRNVPRFFFQKVCNVALYSAKCGVNSDDYKTTGPIAAIDATGTVIDITTGAVVDDNYFAGGLFQWHNLASPTFERRAVLHSVAITGGQRITLDRALRYAVVGTSIDFFPGCNYSAELCQSRFNNIANFRGHPYIPIKNPSANIGEVSTSAGGKKG